jgi:hypothetical protein
LIFPLLKKKDKFNLFLFSWQPLCSLNPKEVAVAAAQPVERRFVEIKQKQKTKKSCLNLSLFLHPTAV